MGMPLGWSQGRSVRGEPPPPPPALKRLGGGGARFPHATPPPPFAAKGKQPGTEALCQPPPPSFAVRVQAVSKGGRVWPTVNVAPKVRVCVLQWGHWCCPPPPPHPWPCVTCTLPVVVSTSRPGVFVMTAYREPPRRADSKSSKFAEFWVRVTSGARVSLGGILEGLSIEPFLGGGGGGLARGPPRSPGVEHPPTPIRAGGGTHATALQCWLPQFRLGAPCVISPAAKDPHGSSNDQFVV